ncbi:MAG: 16S rRNA processing protein RimM, partial [Pseudomonadota bacterium]
MSDDQRLIVVAVILGAHGVRGDVRVKSFTDDPEDSFKYGPLRDSESAALLDPARWRSAKDHFIVTPKVPKSK